MEKELKSCTGLIADLKGRHGHPTLFGRNWLIGWIGVYSIRYFVGISKLNLNFDLVKINPSYSDRRCRTENESWIFECDLRIQITIDKLESTSYLCIILPKIWQQIVPWITSSVQVNYKSSTCCVHQLFCFVLAVRTIWCTQHVLNL